MVLRLKKLSARAAEKILCNPHEFRIFCNSSLPEKRFALESGLGMQGKNSLIYLPGEGSFFILGGLLFPPDARNSAGPSAPRSEPGKICGSCTACMDACPGGAISAPGEIDRKRCIQGLAAESEPLPADIREIWGSVLYGCDICQDVCPLNRQPPRAAETEFGVIGPTVPLKKILAAGEGELRKRVFPGTVLDRAWIAEAAIIRNAVLAAAAQNTKELLPLIATFAAAHPNKVLRETAAWALRRLVI
jgi:epoxyqueuosine reductase